MVNNKILTCYSSATSKQAQAVSMRLSFNNYWHKPSTIHVRTFCWRRTLSLSARRRLATIQTSKWTLLRPSSKFSPSNRLVTSRLLLSRSLTSSCILSRIHKRWNCQVLMSVTSLSRRIIRIKLYSISWAVCRTTNKLASHCPSSRLVPQGLSPRKQRSWIKVRSLNAYLTKTKREGCGPPQGIGSQRAFLTCLSQ